MLLRIRNLQYQFKNTKEVNIRMVQMFEFSDQNFKAVIIKLLQGAITNILQTNGKIGSFSKEIKYFKKQTEILKLNDK